MLDSKAKIPKGSYHAFCRQIYGIQNSKVTNQQTYFKNSRKGYPKTVQTQRNKKIDQFNTFQQYISSINQPKNHPIKNFSKSLALQPFINQIKIKSSSSPIRKSTLTRLNQSQTQRQSKARSQKITKIKPNKQKQDNKQLIGPFLPYFKVKLQKTNHDKSQQKQFKMDNKKFRLKSLLVQQNKMVTQKWFSQM